MLSCPLCQGRMVQISEQTARQMHKCVNCGLVANKRELSDQALAGLARDTHLEILASQVATGQKTVGLVQAGKISAEELAEAAQTEVETGLILVALGKIGAVKQPTT